MCPATRQDYPQPHTPYPEELGSAAVMVQLELFLSPTQGEGIFLSPTQGGGSDTKETERRHEGHEKGDDFLSPARGGGNEAKDTKKDTKDKTKDRRRGCQKGEGGWAGQRARLKEWRGGGRHSAWLLAIQQ